MNKKPRKMGFTEYVVEVQHTHTWYRPDEVLPPPDEDVIVEAKETLSYQCAFYIDPKDIHCKIPTESVFFDKERVPHKGSEIEKGF